MVPIALTIAGSDPSGGAGLQADLKTFHQHRVYGCSVVTLLTVQNTVGVTAVELLSPKFVMDQLDAVLSDVPPAAAKTGALGDRRIIEALAERAGAFEFPLVVDPVMVSKHGDPLLDDEGIETLVEQLLPHAWLVTPNIHEAARIVGFSVGDVTAMEKAAAAIGRLGPPHVLIKGGSAAGDAVDIFWSEGNATTLSAPRIQSTNTHGTGCVLSAAITARLARGEEVLAAVTKAKAFVRQAIATNPNLGAGQGPVNLHGDVDAC